MHKEPFWWPMVAPPLPLTDPDLGLVDGFPPHVDERRRLAHRGWIGLRIKLGKYENLFRVE